MRVAPPMEKARDTRKSRIVCDDRRRVPRGSSRMRVSPCGSRICAVDAHGFPVTCCRLAASRKPVRGTVKLPMARSICGRSFGRRPRALVRLFGSCPNVSDGEPAMVLTCEAAAVAPLETCSPDDLE